MSDDDELSEYIDEGLRELIASGDAEITAFTDDGKPLFRLTEQGQAAAARLIKQMTAKGRP